MPTLNTTAVLATFAGKMWNGRKFDRKTTDEITAMKHTTERAGRFNKNLMPSEPMLKQIKAHLASIRHYHYNNSLPWEWKGGQLLPSKHFMTYSKDMAEFIRQYDDLVDQFCDPTYYQEAINKARISMGDLFIASDYPHVDEVRKQFFATVDFAPLPSAGDYRVDLAATEVQRLKENYQAREEKVIKNATKHLYDRLHDLAAHAHERLGDPNNSFHGTLTENIKKFAELVPDLNISEDQFLNEAAKELRAAVGDQDIKELRDDVDVRADAAEASAGIVEKIKGQMEAFHDGNK